MPAALLSGKVILVTGASTGIGEAVARRCTEEGARVLVHGRDPRRTGEVASSLGERAAACVDDLEDPEAPARLVDAARKRFGRLDGIVNNAALTTRCNLESVTPALFDRLMAVNVRAPMLLVQAALPHFRAQGGGVVVNVGSVNAYCGEPNLLVYSVTKGALMTMTRNLADAHARDGVRINQLNVGWTLTENERRIKEEEGLPSGWENRLPPSYAPYGRIFMPEEVAGHVAFWLSDAAGPVNGAVCELEQYPMIGRNPTKEA